MKRTIVNDLNAIGVQPVSNQDNAFFLANAPRVNNSLTTDWGDLIRDASKVFVALKVEDHKEDVKQGEQDLLAQQNEINAKLAKRETALQGFAQLVSGDQLAEEKSPGTVIGYRQAAGRLLGQDYTRRAQEALETALNEEYKIDPNTTLPTAKRDPAEVIRQVELEFEKELENSSAKWLTTDYYGRETYLDLKGKSSNALLNEYKQRFDEKQKNLHREMLAAEGVALLSKLNKEVSEGRTPEGVVYAGNLPFTEEEARAEFKAWARKVYLGSVKNPSEFVTNVLAAAIDRVQVEEKGRLDKPGQIPNDEEVGSVLFNRFKDTVVGTAPLSKSKPLAFDKLESQLLQDRDQSLSRYNALYAANRSKELTTHISDPEGIHLNTIRTVRDAGEYEARKQLEAWYTKALATNVPYAEEKYQASLQSLTRTLDSQPNSLADSKSESDAYKLAIDGDLDLARDFADYITDPEVKIRTLTRLTQIEQSTYQEASRNPVIKQYKSDLVKFSNSKVEDIILDEQLTRQYYVENDQAILEMENRLIDIAAKKLPKDQQIAEFQSVIDQTRNSITQRRDALAKNNAETLKPIQELWSKNQSAEDLIDDLFNRNVITNAGYNNLMTQNGRKTKFLAKQLAPVVNDKDLDSLFETTLKSGIITEQSIAYGYLFKKEETYGVTKVSKLALSEEGILRNAAIKDKTIQSVVSYFQTEEGAAKLKNPLFRDTIVSKKYKEVLTSNINDELRKLPGLTNDQYKAQIASVVKLKGANADSLVVKSITPLFHDKEGDDYGQAYSAPNPNMANEMNAGMRIANDVQETKVQLNTDPDHKSYTPDKWREFNAANKFRREVYMPTSFDNGITFYPKEDANLKLINEAGVGDPRYMVETGILLGFNKKQWIDKAKNTAAILSDKLLSTEKDPEKKESIYTYLNSVTGISHKDIIDGKYRIGKEEIPITDYSLINWKVTPMFKDESELDKAIMIEDDKKIMKQLGINESEVAKFTSAQRLAIRRLQ